MDVVEFVEVEQRESTKTRLQDYLEKHPNAVIDGYYPVECAMELGYVSIIGCTEYENCATCWNEPIK